MLQSPRFISIQFSTNGIALAQIRLGQVNTLHPFLQEVFAGAVFLYISHNVVEVAKFCDRILVFRGAHKTPQMLLVRGQDHRLGGKLDERALERTMLEIMNAS